MRLPLRVALTALTAASTMVAAAAPASAVTTVSSSAMATYQTNGRVYAVAYGSGAVYLVGDFTTVRPPGSTGTVVTRNHAAAFSTATGSLLAWNPNTNGSVRAVAVSPDQSAVYLGGAFTTVAGAAHTHVAKVGASSGAPSAWSASADSTVKAITTYATTGAVYLGGNFGYVDGVQRRRVAAVRASDGGLVTGFRADLAAGSIYPVANSLVISSGALWVGGAFDTVNGAARQNFAAVSASTGSALAKKPYVSGAAILTTVASSGRVCATGRGTGGFIACFDASTGAKLWGGTGVTDGDVQGSAVGAGVLYAGGHFQAVGATARGHLAAFDAATGALQPWNPGANSTVGVLGMALSADGTHLAAGGDFTIIGGRSQTYFGQFAG